MYGTFARCAWSLALAWVIFACHRGLGGKCGHFPDMAYTFSTDTCNQTKTILILEQNFGI